jgi:hypothetical protein
LLSRAASSLPALLPSTNLSLNTCGRVGVRRPQKSRTSRSRAHLAPLSVRHERLPGVRAVDLFHGHREQLPEPDVVRAQVQRGRRLAPVDVRVQRGGERLQLLLRLLLHLRDCLRELALAPLVLFQQLVLRREGNC